jgi:hypothetical protein
VAAGSPVTIPNLASGMASLTEVEAILLTALVAAIIAAWGVYSQRVITRRLTTIQWLSELQLDQDMIKAKNVFNVLSNPGGKLSTISKAADLEQDETDHVRVVLNTYENTSIGIQFGILDYKIIRLAQKSSIVRDWTRSAPFIYKLRSELNNPAIYHEFEELARWLQDNKMPRRSYWWRLLF